MFHQKLVNKDGFGDVISIVTIKTTEQATKAVAILTLAQLPLAA